MRPSIYGGRPDYTSSMPSILMNHRHPWTSWPKPTLILSSVAHVELLSDTNAQQVSSERRQLTRDAGPVRMWWGGSPAASSTLYGWRGILPYKLSQLAKTVCGERSGAKEKTSAGSDSSYMPNVKKNGHGLHSNTLCASTEARQLQTRKD